MFDSPPKNAPLKFAFFALFRSFKRVEEGYNTYFRCYRCKSVLWICPQHDFYRDAQVGGMPTKLV